MHRHFWFGLVAGVGLVWGYHHFVSPMPGAKGQS